MNLAQQSELMASKGECQKLRAKLARMEMALGEKEARMKEQREMAEKGWRQQKEAMERELAKERKEVGKSRRGQWKSNQHN
jgi:hypothetical protein